MKRNVSSQVIGAQMTTISDGSNFTGSVIVYVTGDGGTQAVGSVSSGACVHEGKGFHTYVPAQAETNYDHVAFTFEGTGAVTATVQVYTDFPQTGDAFVRLGSPVGASVSADLVTLQADTDNIQTRIPAALVGGRIDASVGAMAANVITATAINADAITDAKVASDVTIASVTGAVGSVTGSVGSVTGAVGSVTGSVGSIAAGGIASTSFAAGAITATAIASDAITDAKVAADVTIASVTGAVGSVTAGVTVTTNNDKAGYALSSAGVQAVWDALTSALTTAGSIGKYIVDSLVASTAPTAIENADALLKRDWTSVSGEAARSVLNALRVLRNKVDLVSTPGSVLVKKEDDSTNAWAASLTTDAAALPITSVDPTT